MSIFSIKQDASFVHRDHTWEGLNRFGAFFFFGIKIHHGGISRQTRSSGKHTFPIAVKSWAAFSALFISKELNSPPLALFSSGRGPVKPLETEGLVSVKRRMRRKKKNTGNDHCRQYIKELTAKTRPLWLWQRAGFDVSIILSGEAEQSIGEMTGCVPITPRLWGGLMRLVLIVSSTHTQCPVIDCYCKAHRGAFEVHSVELTHLRHWIHAVCSFSTQDFPGVNSVWGAT